MNQNKIDTLDNIFGSVTKKHTNDNNGRQKVYEKLELMAIEEQKKDDLREVVIKPYTPFGEYFVDDYYSEMKGLSSKEIGNCDMIKNYQVGDINRERNPVALQIMIEEFQKNDIKFAIFSTPLHENCFKDLQSINSNEIFEKALNDISIKNSINIYPLHDAYWDYDAWSNIEHLTHNAFLYSEDVAKIILKEIP